MAGVTEPQESTRINTYAAPRQEVTDALHIPVPPGSSVTWEVKEYKGRQQLVIVVSERTGGKALHATSHKEK